MIGKPRKKDDAELAWDAIKRAITAQVNYEAQIWRQHKLNDQLAEAFERFESAYKDGIVLGVSKDALKELGPGGKS